MYKKLTKLLLKYFTARIDILNTGNSNGVIFLENSDKNANILQLNPGHSIIESKDGFLDLKLKCVNACELKILLRGQEIYSGNNKLFPVYIDYTNFSVNGQNIFIDNKLVWYDEPFVFIKNVEDSEIIEIHIEWLPFNELSEYNSKSLCNNQIEELKLTKEKLSLRESQIRSIPQLSRTTLGKSALGGKVVYRNWLALNSNSSVLDDFKGYCDGRWLTIYLKNKFPDVDFKINVFGVCNAHDNLAYPMDGKKVLYSAEDLNYRFLEMKVNFDKYALDYVDLALGFDFVDHPNYFRFPYWLTSLFAPTVTDEEIENEVDMWNSLNHDKSKDVALVASHDIWGTRTLIDKDVNSIADVEYAGKWKNNTSDLWEKFKNNKFEYLNQFKFNLCPENLLVDAYVTEKVFDAIKCDCIPLYAGGGNYLEPKVLNPNAIIRWFADEILEYDDPNIETRASMGDIVHYPVKWVADDDRNSDSIELFKNILTDEKTYLEFKDQEKVLESSKKYIIKQFSELEHHFERLIYD